VIVVLNLKCRDWHIDEFMGKKESVFDVETFGWKYSSCYQYNMRCVEQRSALVIKGQQGECGTCFLSSMFCFYYNISECEIVKGTYIPILRGKKGGWGGLGRDIAYEMCTQFCP
jgi:hypothetical protein